MTAMTISDDERREVARRLRELADYCDENEMSLSDDDWPGILSDYIWPEDGGYHIYDDDCRRLADLIEPSEPKVKCVAEVKVDGERLEKLAHDAAAELTGIDRDALLALADKMDKWALTCDHYDRQVSPLDVTKYARRIREALGVSDG